MNRVRRDFPSIPKIWRDYWFPEETQATLKGWSPCMNRTLRSPAETDGLQLAQPLFASSILTCWRLGEHSISGTAACDAS
jgi:hypothetical protein